MSVATAFKAQDAVWIATALLHREQPEAAGFSALEIKERALREGFDSVDESTLYQHAQLHCVANRPPNTSKLRMLWAIDEKLRRLYRPGDSFHPARADRKTIPTSSDLPPKYAGLLQWYAQWSNERPDIAPADPLLALVCSGRQLWADEHADDYLRALRENW